jgi:hypothetical protein
MVTVAIGAGVYLLHAVLSSLGTDLGRRSGGSDRPQSIAKARAGQGASGAHRPYPALQGLFGEGETANWVEPSSWGKRLNRSNSTLLVAGDGVPGIILRSKVENYVTIVPPWAARRVFAGKSNERKADPFSIPFYGAKWVFRAAEKTLPAGLP